jgi:hypothetical protein
LSEAARNKIQGIEQKGIMKMVDKDKLEMFQRVVDATPAFKEIVENDKRLPNIPPPPRLPAKETTLTLSPEQIEEIAEAVANKVVAKLKPEGAS